MAHRSVTIWMLETDEGGLKTPMTTPTPSLLLRFSEQEAMAEAMIRTTDDAPLVPGECYEVSFEFWNAASEAEARSGRRFDLWHGRIVGSGRFN